MKIIGKYALSLMLSHYGLLVIVGFSTLSYTTGHAASHAASSTLSLSNAITRSASPLALIPFAEVLLDSTGKLTIEQLESGLYDAQFKRYTMQEMDVRLTQSVYWIRFVLINQSDEKNWYIDLGGALSRHVDTYWRSGDATPFVLQPLMPRSRLLKYHFSLTTGIRQTFYLRMQDKTTPLVLEPKLYTVPQLLARVTLLYPLYSFLVGGLLTLALYNFIYFVYLRDRGFLTLSLFILFFVIEMSNHSGLLYYFRFLHETLYNMGAIFAFLVMASGFSLVMNMMNIRDYVPFMIPWFRGGFWLSIGLAIVYFFLPYGTMVAVLVGGGELILTLISVVLIYHQGHRLPSSLLLALAVFIITIIPILLRGTGIIESNPLLFDAPYLGLLLALTLLSLIQANKVRIKSEQVERIAASNHTKDEFLTTMSHELRTPMNAVVNAGHLLTLTPLSNQQQNYVTRLNISSKHMLSLVNDILDLARVDSRLLRLEQIPFRLDSLLQHVEQLLLEQARSKRLVLVFDNQFYPLKKQLVGDPTRLKQVLLNLLSNSIKFTPQGEVKVTITPRNVVSEHACLHFEVHDSGIGMTTEQQRHLFQPFSQADVSTTRKYGGSGLGLAISHKLIQRMEGELKVESNQGQGSRFFFTLVFPLQEVLPEAETITKILPSTFFTKLHILLVDDDEMNRFFGSKIIKILGVQVETAESGQDALNRIDTTAFDLVFMDVSMPDMDGYETTRRLRADHRFINLPIVALTAHAIAGERERCLAAGMNDYLTKPFEVEQLQMMIQQWSKKRRVGG
jgi:signal transduction histidine kinase/CheY-like chemotaxis protein